MATVRPTQSDCATRRSACDHMDGLLGKGAAITLGAPVGDEVNRNAALCQRRRERFGRKQMTTRTPAATSTGARPGASIRPDSR